MLLRPAQSGEPSSETSNLHWVRVGQWDPTVYILGNKKCLNTQSPEWEVHTVFRAELCAFQINYNGLNYGVHLRLWVFQRVTTESAAAQSRQKLCTATCGGHSPGRRWFGFIHPLLGEFVCRDQSAEAARWDPSLRLTPADLSLFCHDAEPAAAHPTWQKKCVASGKPLEPARLFVVETGSPSHTDTLLLNRGHISLAANALSLYRYPLSQSQLLPLKPLSLNPLHICFCFLLLANVLLFPCWILSALIPPKKLIRSVYLIKTPKKQYVHICPQTGWIKSSGVNRGERLRCSPHVLILELLEQKHLVPLLSTHSSPLSPETDPSGLVAGGQHAHTKALC